jgi:hypothetical protein
MPHGGSEVGNQMLIEEFGLKFVGSRDIKEFSKDDFYVISNVSLMNPNLVKQIKNYNYIIFECDYKIVQHRHPWRYPNSIIPKADRINYDLYENAQAVFVKSTDHLNVYKANDVKARFINLRTNIWAEEDLQLFEKLYYENREKNGRNCIYNTQNWIKNAQGAIKYCTDNKLEYGFIENGNDREKFLSDMAKYSTFVFFPLARETYCRIVVEAKCLGLDVITTKNYGVVLEDYFGLKGPEMIDYLRIGNKINIQKMGKYIPKN